MRNNFINSHRVATDSQPKNANARNVLFLGRKRKFIKSFQSFAGFGRVKKFVVNLAREEILC